MDTEPPARLLIQAEQAFNRVVARPAEGRRDAERVAVAAREAHANEALVVALRAAGWAAREQYDHDAAKRYLDEAARVARRSRLDARLSEVLITRSATHLERGDTRQARRDLDRAEDHAGPRTRAEVRYAQALLEDAVGDLQAAADAYEQVLQLEQDARADVRFKAMNNLGLVKLLLGRFDEADRMLARAATLAATFSPTFAGHAAESRATAAIEQGRPVEALQRYEEAERLLNDVGVHLVDLHLGKANAMLSLRLLDEAADAAARAVRLVEDREGGSLMLAEALIPTAQIALARGDLAMAAEAASRAENLHRSQGRRGWQMRAALLRTQIDWQHGRPTSEMIERLGRIERTMRHLGNLPATVDAALLHGQVAAAMGRRRRALAALERAAADGRGPALLRLRGRLATALKAELTGHTRQLSQVCRIGLEELGRYRAIFASAELRTRAAAHGSTLGEIGLRAATRSGRTEAIWAWMERSRAIIAVREGPVEADSDVRPQLAQLRSLESRLSDISPEDVAEQRQLLQRIAHLERRIRNHLWTRRAETAAPLMPSVTTLRELRSDLHGRTLLQYAVLDGRVLAVAVTGDRLFKADLGAAERVRASGRTLAFALRSLSSPRSPASVAASFASARHELTFLGNVLTAPFTKAISCAGQVVVVPPPELMSVPWGALPPLLRHDLHVAPTAMLWRRTRDREPGSDRIVAVSGPGLQAADDEVSSVAACYTHPEVLAGENATVDAVRSAAVGARVVHLACHGRLRRDTAAFSSLRLHDGPLTVHDLEQLPRSAHHWVLAACDLGSPGRLVGPELDGVVASLLMGGAAGVVAAVVSVPDAHTSGLMTDLHASLATGASLAAALRDARAGADTDDPAGFVASVAFSCYGGG